MGSVRSYSAAAFEIELSAARAPSDYAIVNRQTGERTVLSFGLSVDGRHDHVTPTSQQTPLQPKSEVLAMKKPTELEAVRRAGVRQLFTAHHPKEATDDHVCLFFRWLQQHHQEMLPKASDPYLALRADLDGLYQDL
jgi:hypothetical protein